MKTINRAARLALGTTAALALALSGTTTASAATWELLHSHQQICSSTAGHPGSYFIAAVVGKWTTTVQIALRNLPPGATSMGGTPIPPGSNYTNPDTGATTINGFVHIQLAPLPTGVYHAQLTASDGTETQSNPITINVNTGNC
ncbi:DUF5980 family protein [Nonomuraea sp. NPDC050404]|uniref:DUF5980 family protein n=1 Tax=Nonomuraea sp. NPDC050404 TaxID=3155783 RepID=UPI0033C8F26B